ncbi:hypothetical protein DPEC_G00357730 [Dallia pectoralis]|uniref:Uncharacterized protein n=1 Tax=Dallia pectoralis TaxID=75939 RepID=A0ACC2F097_DALPE|nr:hypothetical protein DPEC_G00357730 [Dallia pectoralis]
MLDNTKGTWIKVYIILLETSIHPCLQARGTTMFKDPRIVAQQKGRFRPGVCKDDRTSITEMKQSESTGVQQVTYSPEDVLPLHLGSSPLGPGTEHDAAPYIT